jgi:hypothetical protein
MNHSVARLLKASCSYFALVFGAGFILGAVRIPFVVPRLGVRTAELLEMPLMFVVVVVSARFVVKRFDLLRSSRGCLWVGLSALALLLGAEVTLAVAIQGRSLARYIEGRDPVSGSVYIAMLCLFAAMPLVVARTESQRLRSPTSR